MTVKHAVLTQCRRRLRSVEVRRRGPATAASYGGEQVIVVHRLAVEGWRSRGVNGER